MRSKRVERQIPVMTRSERLLLKHVLDLVVVNNAIQIFCYRVFQVSIERQIVWFLSSSALWFVSTAISNLNMRSTRKFSFVTVRDILLSTVIFVALFYATPYVTPRLTADQTLNLFAVLFGVCSVSRILLAISLRSMNTERRVLVLGNAEIILPLQEALELSRSQFTVIGVLTSDDSSDLLNQLDWKKIGSASDLVKVVEEQLPQELILALSIDDLPKLDLFKDFSTCRELGVHIITASTMIERIMGRVPVVEARKDIYAVLPLHQNYLTKVVQRCFDIAFGVLGCLFTLIVVPFVWLANRLNKDNGPLFYHQERTGLYGAPFSIVKFRSMRVDAEAGGAVWAAQNDNRITAVGNFLRKSRIDEIPQFWNILRGDMSLIGPRPERPEFVEILAKELPFYRSRHAVKPGLTGWAQVRYRYGSSVKDSLVKLEYDLYYIKHQGFLMNLMICLRTFGVVLGLKGR